MDEFVEEIHEIRKRIAEECGYDFQCCEKLSEQRADRHAKAGQHVVADEYVGRSENGDLVAAAIHGLY